MRFLLSIFLLSVFFLTVKTDVNAKAPKEKVRTIINGHVPYLAKETETIVIKLWDDDNLMEPYKNMPAQIKDGHFEIELFIEKIYSLTLVVGTNKVMGDTSVGATGWLLHIEPGDSLHLLIPKENSRLNQDIVVTGRGSEKEKFIRNFNKELAIVIAKAKNNPASTPAIAIDKCIEFKKATDNILKRNRTTISKTAFDKIEGRILNVLYYSAYLSLTNFDFSDEANRKLYNKIVKHYPLKSLVYDSRGNIRIINSTLCINWALISFLDQNRLSLKYEGDYLRLPDLMYRIVSTTYPDKRIWKRVMAQYIIDKGRAYKWKKGFEDILYKYLSIIPSGDPWRFQVETFKMYAQGMLAENSTAFEFSLQDSSGVVRKQSEFKGRVVVLDFMFTGCGACAEIRPKLEEVQSYFKGKDVEFISISIDATASLFKKGIGIYSSKTSLALYTNGAGTNHPVIRHYGIYSYPTLVLIGKKGTVITSRAPEPRTEEGEKELIRLIEKALNG